MARRLGLWAAPFLAVALAGGAANAVPSFAIQTGQPCQACHVGGFGPRLTPFGREFKLKGYTIRAVKWSIPVSGMVQSSYVSTAKGQTSTPAPGYRDNNNFSLDQASIFFAGGVGHFGAFVQTTYDGVAKAWHWDNLDVRAITTATFGKTEALFGMSLNNAPTTQDAWNTLPAWGYPFTSSGLAPTPGAGPIIGALAQNTLGLTGYVWLDSQFYLEAGGYQSPSSGFLTHAGVDPTDPGSIAGTAPYARVAWQKNYGDRNFEIGAFAMRVNINPGLDTTTGVTDRYTDLGLDGSYQIFAAHGDVYMLDARYTHESQSLRASQALGTAANQHQALEDLRVDASYYWRDKIGFTLGAFDTWGSTDPILYSGSAIPRPNSAGLLGQIDATPWGAGGSPLGPRFNIRVGVQYTDYMEFNGAGANYDGFGRKADENNTFRVFTWIAY